MDALSDEILIHIFAQATGNDISLWRRVSRRWDNLINDDFVWKTAFLSFWNKNLPLSRVDPISWKSEYLTRMEQINKMSNKRPISIKIATKKNSSIRDIWIAPNYPNNVVKVLELTGMTNAIIRNDGSLDQKFVLFFDKMYGISPITCCKFSKSNPFKMILGNAIGEIFVYDKAPHKSLLEDYHVINNVASKLSVADIFPHNNNTDLLTLHSSGQSFHEFVNWKSQPNGSFHFTGILPISELKTSCPIYSDGVITKLAFITNNGQVSMSNLSTTNETGNYISVPLTKISLQSATFLQISNSTWFILIAENRILIFCHETEKLVNSFSLPNTREIQIFKEIACNSQIFDLFIFAESYSLVKLRINPMADQMEIIQNDLMENINQILSIHVTPIYFILVTVDGIFIHDTLNLQRINKCSFPKFSLKYLDDNNEPIKIQEFDDNKFIFIWGDSLAQVWDFAPISKDSGRLKTTRNSEFDKGTVGGKSIRKYAKYTLNSSIVEWKDEQREEEKLDSLRDRLNIEGLNEEELIAYAKLISNDINTNNSPELPSTMGSRNGETTDFSDDPDLQLALQLSLIEM